MCFGVDGALIALYGVFLGAGYGWLSVGVSCVKISGGLTFESFEGN